MDVTAMLLLLLTTATVGGSGIVQAPASPPENVLARALSSSTVIVSWDEPKNFNGVIQGYNVFYTLKPKDPIFFWEQQDVKNDIRSTTISGLTPDVIYTIRVLAYSSIDEGPMSRPIQVLTDQGVPSPPRNLHVDLVQEDPPSVRVTWQRPAETHGDIKYYKIIWGPRGEKYEERILNSEIYSYVTNTLDKGKTYEFGVSAKNEVDYGERAVATITTPGEDCSEGLQQCTNIYMADVMEHARSGNIGMICQDLNIFIKCYFDLECGLQEEQKNLVIEKVKQEIAAQGFDCDVNLEGVSTRRPKTTIAPEYTTKPTTCLGATQVCTQSYINEAFKMARDRSEDLSWFCPLINTFVACLVDSPCHIDEVQNVVKDKIEAELRQKGIDCDVSLEGVSTRRPNTTIAPEYTTNLTKYNEEDVYDYDELTTSAMTAQVPLSSTAPPQGQQPPEWVHHILTALKELQEQLVTLNSKVDKLLAEREESIES